MGKRLFLVSLLALSVACKSKSTADDESSVPGGDVRGADVGRDATERALLSLGIEGAVRRTNLAVSATKVFLLSDLILVESTGKKPFIWAVNRADLTPAWKSLLAEATMFEATENSDHVLLVAAHHLHAFDKISGNNTMQFVGGTLDGIARPALALPFTPTGSAAAQHDTVYMGSLGSASSNKTVETFSLITGGRGWGYRTSSDIYLPPLVGGPTGDPKLYFVTRTGHVTCLDAKNYGYRPTGPRWEELLEAGVRHPMAVTKDTRGNVGGIFIVDDEGMVYCLDRITGNRRWTNATGRVPAGGPKVFGNICVVRMKDGLTGFDAHNVVYAVGVTNGPDKGEFVAIHNGAPKAVGNGEKVDLSLSDSTTGQTRITFKVEGELLTATAEGGSMRVDGGEETQRAVVRAGSEISVGDTTLTVNDRGTEPMWVSLPYEEIVCRVGDKLVARRGSTLTAIDAWTGERVGDPVDVPGARFFPANTHDGNLYVVNGGGVVYALFPR